MPLEIRMQKHLVYIIPTLNIPNAIKDTRRGGVMPWGAGTFSLHVGDGAENSRFLSRLMSGKNKRINATTMMGPEIGRMKKMAGDP